jgi:hypothetical protein
MSGLRYAFERLAWTSEVDGHRQMVVWGDKRVRCHQEGAPLNWAVSLPRPGWAEKPLQSVCD